MHVKRSRLVRCASAALLLVGCLPVGCAGAFVGALDFLLSSNAVGNTLVLSLSSLAPLAGFLSRFV